MVGILIFAVILLVVIIGFVGFGSYVDDEVVHSEISYKLGE